MDMDKDMDMDVDMATQGPRALVFPLMGERTKNEFDALKSESLSVINWQSYLKCLRVMTGTICELLRRTY